MTRQACFACNSYQLYPILFCTCICTHLPPPPHTHTHMHTQTPYIYTSNISKSRINTFLSGTCEKRNGQKPDPQTYKSYESQSYSNNSLY